MFIHRTQNERHFHKARYRKWKKRCYEKKMLEVIERLIVEKGIKRFVSGGAIETDQTAFILVQYLKERKYPEIENILAIPYKEQSKAWVEQLERIKQKIKFTKDEKILDQLNFEKKEIEMVLNQYEKMLELADKVVYVDELEKYKPKSMKQEDIGKHSNQKLQLRNIYMLDESTTLIAVYNGKEKGGTANCVRSAVQKKKRIIYLNPNKNFEESEHVYEASN